MKKKLILVLIALLMLALPAVALADTGGTVDVSVVDILIENAVNIATAFFVALIGVLGAWLTAKLGKATQLDTVNHAQQELIKLAQITVGELKQDGRGWHEGGAQRRQADQGRDRATRSTALRENHREALRFGDGCADRRAGRCFRANHGYG